MSKPSPAPALGAIYGRQSRTKDGSESLETQEAIGRETLARFGVELVAVLIEPPSTSGYEHRGRNRPRFLELLDLIASGAVTTVFATRLDRLSRGGGPGWAPLLDAAEKAGLDVDRLVLTPSGYVSEFEIGIRAAMDREESKKRADQLQDLKERHAADGRPSGGGYRPFGYAADHVTIVEAEAGMIQDAAARILAGESLANVCRGWNAAGTLTSRSSEWRPSTLRNMLLTARLAGLREHLGTVVGEAVWPPILDRATWEAVRAFLTDPNRRAAPPTRTSLLYGLARCGRCGAKLTVAPVGGRRSYRCPKAPGRPGCGGLAIVAEPLEAIIVAAVLDALDTPGLTRAALGTPEEIDTQAGADVAVEEARLAELADMFAQAEITRAEWIRARRGIEDRLDAARRRAARVPRGKALEGLEGGKLGEAWPTLPNDRRRAVLAVVLDRVEIAPARRGLNRFDPDRIHLVWIV